MNLILLIFFICTRINIANTFKKSGNTIRIIKKNKKVIGLTKDELKRKILTECVSFRPKIYSYLMNGGSNDKKAKETKK